MIVKVKNYYGVVLASSGDNLFIVSPKYTKVSPKASSSDVITEHENFKRLTGKKRGIARVSEDDVEYLENDCETLIEAASVVDSLASNVIKNVRTEMASDANPLNAYSIKKYFDNGKNIDNINDSKEQAEVTSQALTALGNKVLDIANKINNLRSAIDTQATLYNVKGVSEAVSKLDATMESLATHKAGKSMLDLAAPFVEDDEEFDAEAYLGL